MKRAAFLFFILILVFSVKSKAQSASIDLVFFNEDFSSLDINTFYSNKNLSNVQRIFQVIINPSGINAYLEGKVEWQENFNSNKLEVASFQTMIFQTRNFFSDEIGSAPDLQRESLTLDNSVIEDIILKGGGKLIGIVTITIRMFSENGQFLDDAFKEIVILNPTPPTITLPQNASQYDVGNIPLQWTAVNGVLRYLIKANTYNEGIESPIAALNSGTPIIDDFDAGVTTSVNLATVTKTREWYSGQKVVVIVKAIISESGREKELNSEPITFEISQVGGVTLESSTNLEPDANMIRLANLVQDGLSSADDFLTMLKNGTIKLGDVQIFDENNQPITAETFMIILSFLEANNSLIISKTFIPKP